MFWHTQYRETGQPHLDPLAHRYWEKAHEGVQCSAWRTRCLETSWRVSKRTCECVDLRFHREREHVNSLTAEAHSRLQQMLKHWNLSLLITSKSTTRFLALLSFNVLLWGIWELAYLIQKPQVKNTHIHGFMWDFGNTANPRHRRHTYLEVHLVPCTEIIEVTGRLCQIFQILLLFYFTSFPRFSSLSVYRSEKSCKVLGWWDTHRNGEKLVFRSLKATADRLGASLATALNWFWLWWHVSGLS